MTNPLKDAAKEAIAQKLATATTTAGGATAMYGGYTAQELIGMGGLAVAIAGFLVNWYYAHKRYKLQQSQQNQESAQS